MTEPTIKGSITRAIEALEGMDDCVHDLGFGTYHDEKWIKPAQQALADLKAFKEALPDGFRYQIQLHADNTNGTSSIDAWHCFRTAAKLIAEVVKDD